MGHNNRYHPYYINTNTNNITNINQQQLQQNIVNNYNPICCYHHHYYNQQQQQQQQQQELPEFRCPMEGEVRDVDEYFKSLPAGYRFCPLDEELIVHYLRPKIDGVPLPIHRIPNVYLYRHTPEQLTGCYKLIREKEWYFFTPRTRKYKNGNRPDRSVFGLGYWKPTGQDTLICSNGQPIGHKKSLDYCIGKHPGGQRSEWKMHEYRIIDQTGAPSTSTSSSNTTESDDKKELDPWVLCKIYKNSRPQKNSQDGTVGSATGDRDCSSASTSTDLDQDTTVGSDQED